MDSKQARAVATWYEITDKINSGLTLTTSEEYIYTDIIETQKNSIDNVQSVNFTIRMMTA